MIYSAALKVVWVCGACLGRHLGQIVTFFAYRVSSIVPLASAPWGWASLTAYFRTQPGLWLVSGTGRMVAQSGRHRRPDVCNRYTVLISTPLRSCDARNNTSCAACRVPTEANPARPSGRNRAGTAQETGGQEPRGRNGAGIGQEPGSNRTATPLRHRIGQRSYLPPFFSISVAHFLPALKNG
jgi:hypothetical protein